METIIQKQFRLLRNSLFIQEVYHSPIYNNNVLKRKIIGENITCIDELRSYFPVEVVSFRLSHKVETKNKIFKLYTFYYKSKHVATYTLYLITVNDRVYYFNKSSIYAPASSAFETLTECFHNGLTKESNWQFISLYEAKLKYYMFDGTESIYKVKTTDKKELIDEKIDKLYYHYK